MNTLSTSALQRLAADPRPPASPWSDTPLLLIDSAGAEDFDDARVFDWLAQQPVPVIAIGPRSALTQACDVHLHDGTGLPALRRSIEASPLAATVLVQTLRLGAQLGDDDALTIESLAYASLQEGAEFRRWRAGITMPPAGAEDGAAVEIEREGGHLNLCLNRPGNRNAMTVEMRDALLEALQLALADDSIETLAISARGRCFSTGGDLREFGSAPDPASAHLVRSLALPGRLLARLAGRTRARLHGACIGSGIEFPAFADRVTAAPGSWFQLPELRYGLIPGAGGTVGIRRRIGRQRTAWWALSGAKLDARTALDWGLIDAIEG